jgi:hypothetical protein
VGENLNCQKEEEFEDTKGAIRIRISKKNRQHNGQKKKSTKGKRRYILDRSGNHQQITPNQCVTSGAGTAYPSGGPGFTLRILVRFGLLDLWFYIYVL